MTDHAHDWRADVEAIRKILISDWDPIGCGVPDDEYDDYIGGIYSLIQRQVSVDELTLHLDKLESDTMGLPAVSNRNLAVAKLLLERIQ